jgi:hypothetical protein
MSTLDGIMARLKRADEHFAGLRILRANVEWLRA